MVAPSRHGPDAAGEESPAADKVPALRRNVTGTSGPAVPPVLSAPARQQPRPDRRYLWMVALPVLLGLAVLWHFDPARYGLYPRCTFHEVTGWQCPGCGGLRATHALLHGRWGESWRYNPIPLLALPLLLVSAATLGWYRLRGREVPWNRVSVLVRIAMAALVLFGLLRNLV